VLSAGTSTPAPTPKPSGRTWPHLPPLGRCGADHRHRGPGLQPPRRPDPAVLRRALFAWAFNPGTRNLTAPAETSSALEWITRASLPVTALESDAATVRLALGACARTGTGTPAAASTQRRKRAVFYNAVELRLLTSNPIDRIQWKTPAVAQTVDRRVVAGPAQARALLAAVRAVSDRGRHLEAFYACLYYAALRPSEAVMLRETDCHLPGRRWGRIDLAGEPRAFRTADLQ
jgi:integrase